VGRDTAGQVFLGLALLWTLTMPLSIAVSETALWLAVVAWCVNWLRSELSLDGASVPDQRAGPAGDLLPLVGTPLMAFWGISVISALASRAPVESMWEVRDVFLFAAAPVTYLAYQHPRMRRLAVRVFGVGIVVAVLIGLAGTISAVDAGVPDYRPDGTLGHYMTYAGVLMLAIPLLLTVGGRRGWLWHRAIVIGALLMIGLTMTRSAWIGCIAGLACWVVTRFVTGEEARDRSGARRALTGYAVTLVVLVVIAAIVLLSLAGPEALLARGASIFSLENETNVDRLAMAATGLRIIRAHPWFGIGPGLMERVYPAWRVDWAVKEVNPHLHNDVLQIAAERGVLGLAAWLWLMAAICFGAWRVLRYAGAFGEGGPEARAALSALTAFLTMGLFEYNFSDSEVIMVLLFIATLPFAASTGIARARHAQPPGPGEPSRIS
jgi:O-antigen ligase